MASGPSSSGVLPGLTCPKNGNSEGNAGRHTRILFWVSNLLSWLLLSGKHPKVLDIHRRQVSKFKINIINASTHAPPPKKKKEEEGTPKTQFSRDENGVGQNSQEEENHVTVVCVCECTKF